VEFYSNCSELPLKIFFDIANTRDYTLLLKGKYKYIDDIILAMAWEDIMHEWITLSENNSAKDVIAKTDQQFKEAAKYCEIKAMLLYLVGGFKQEYIDRLNQLGYKINTTDREQLIKSIQTNYRRTNQINTKVKIIQKDIERSIGKTKKQTFDAAMAELSIELKFEPDQNITCARYLEYKKIIRERNRKK